MKSAGSTQLQSVLVTAQRRTEDVKSVPISMSVLSGEDLDAKRIANYDDLSRAVPGLSFNSLGAAEGLTNVVIRGVSSTSGSATVGIYLDDVSITVKNFYDGTSEPKLNDLSRIEVLRGPQGTLFGASSEGGTIRFISAAPDMRTFSADVNGDISSTKHGGTNHSEGAVLNVPVQPGVFAIRASMSNALDSGYIDHYTQQGELAERGINSARTQVVHLLGKLTPGSDLIISPTFFSQSVQSADNAAFYPALGLYRQDKQVREYGRDTMTLGSLSVQKGLGFADFTSVTGAFERRYKRQQDGSYYNATLFAEAFLDPLYPDQQAQNDAVIGNLASPVKFDTRYKQFSQELRLSSTKDDAAANPLKWIGGLYFADQNIHNTDFQQIPGINTAFQSIYGIPMEDSLVQTTFGAPGITLFPNDIDESDDRTYREKQYAVFGQLDYDLRPDWHIGAGVRYMTAREDYVSTEIGFYQIGNISPYNQAASFHAFTPKATLSHDIDADHTVYASVSKGFRFGGPTGPIVYGPTSVCASDFATIGQTSQPTKFDSDSLWTYEAGTKNGFAGGSGSVSAAAFYTQWDNIQQQIYLPTCGYYFTTNAGNARIYGAEVEAALKVTAQLQLSVTASAENATITKTKNPLTVPDGAHLIDVPVATVTGGGTYVATIGDTGRLTSRLDYTWTGHSYGSYQPDNSNYANPSYGVANASLTYASGSFELGLYAKNAFDNRTIIQRPQINTVVEGYTVRPRTIGVTGRLFF